MSPEPTRRPQRRDAKENRERILEHSEELMAQEGFDVSFHRIADDLGVGIGTVYRHFPDRNALLVGLYERFQARIDERGGEMFAAEPGLERVLVFIDVLIDFSVRTPLSRQVAARVHQANPDRVPQSRWTAEVMAAVEAAKTAGQLRQDIEATDVAMLAGMVADLATIHEPRRSIVVPRMRAFILDAMRPAGEDRPPVPATALSVEDLALLAHQENRR